SIVLIELLAAPKPEALAGEELGILIVVQVQAEQVLAGFVMAILQGLGAHGNELALGIGGPGTLGEPFDRGGPEQFLFPPSGTFDQGGDVLIAHKGHPVAELLIVRQVLEPVFPTQKGILGKVHQLPEHLVLYLRGKFQKEFDLVIALSQQPGSNGIEQGYRHFWVSLSPTLSWA